MVNRKALKWALATIAVLLGLFVLFVRPYVTVISNLSYGEDQAESR